MTQNSKPNSPMLRRSKGIYNLVRIRSLLEYAEWVGRSSDLWGIPNSSWVIGTPKVLRPWLTHTNVSLGESALVLRCQRCQVTGGVLLNGVGIGQFVAMEGSADENADGF